VQVEEQSGMDRANNVLLKAGLETLGPLDNLSAEARNKLHDRIRKADVHEEQVLLKAIVIQLQSEQDPQKRREIMIHLATFGRNQVVAATLKGMLHSESDRGIRKLAAYILGKVGSEEDIDDLLDAIKKDKGAFPHGRDLANTAYFSIGEIGGDKAAIILLKLWDDKELVPDFSLFSMGFASRSPGKKRRSFSTKCCWRA
jgi:HEAT repeat protein